jgi:hypothetical protein
VLPILLLATLIAYAPVIVYGYPADGWDSRYHAISARLFSDQLWSGEFYPRWLNSMNAGLGSPFFFYYPPLAYYVASAFDWFSAPTAIPQLGAASLLLGLLSGITCYLWLVRILPGFAALTGAVFYLASPFHVFTDLFVRADYAEFAAMTFTPIALLGVELLRERKWIGIPVISLGFAAVVLSHVVVGLLFAAVPTVYAAARCFGRSGWLVQVLLVLAACLLGLGISGFYLVPALAYRPDAVVPVIAMTPGKFVFGGGLPQVKLILFVWMLFLGYGALLVAMAFWRRIAPLRGELDNLIITCLGLAGLTLAFSTIWARPVWLMLPILWALQFTYRLFVVIDLCAAALVGAFVAAATSRFAMRRAAGATRGIILAMAAGAAAFAVHSGLFNFDAPLWRERVRYAEDFGLFRPGTVRSDLPADRLPLYSGGDFGPGIPLPARTQIVEGDAQAQVLAWRPRSIVLQINARTPGRVLIGQLYFPGWQAIDEASGMHLPVAPSDGEGLLTMPFAAGNQRLAVSLRARPPEYAGIALSVLSLAGMIGLYGGARRLSARVPGRQQAPVRQ